MESLKISMVTPALNSASTIRETIESVQGQDYENWEHIVVDGGSRVQAVHEVNHGSGSGEAYRQQKSGDERNRAGGFHLRFRRSKIRLPCW